MDKKYTCPKCHYPATAYDKRLYCPHCKSWSDVPIEGLSNDETRDGTKSQPLSAMGNKKLSIAMLASILDLYSQSGAQKKRDEYSPDNFLKVAHLPLFFGAILIKLEPERFAYVDKELPQHEPYTMKLEKEFVKRAEQARNLEGYKGSYPFIAEIWRWRDDVIKTGNKSFSHTDTTTAAAICFQRGCILGSLYPDRIEEMYHSDYPDQTLPWESLVELTKMWLKNGNFS